MRSEEFASYKQRQMPLPLYINPREVHMFIITFIIKKKKKNKKKVFIITTQHEYNIY